MGYWRMFGWAPWWRGPVLLLRRPAVMVALAVASAVAALPVASLPLFLSSAGSATLHARADNACPWELGSQVFWAQWFPGKDGAAGSLGGAAVAEQVAAEKAIAGETPGLSAAVMTAFTDAADIKGPGTGAGTDTARAVLGYRDGFADHVQVVTGSAGRGVWLTEEVAAQLAVKVGDRVTLSPNPRRPGYVEQKDGRVVTVAPKPADVAVAGIYRDLRQSPVTRYWCSTARLFQGPPDAGPNTPIFPLALLDYESFVDVADQHVADVGVYLERQVDRLPAVTLPAAAELGGRIDALHGRMRAEFKGPRKEFADRHREGFTDQGGGKEMSSLLHGISSRAVVVQDNLGTTLTPISAAGLAVGLAVVMAAGIMWVRRRRPELVVLAVRGATGGQLGVKAVLEAAPALAVGTAAGWALASLLVARFGPGGPVTAEARTQAILLGALCFLACTAVIGVTATIACRRLAGVAPEHRRRLPRVAWEVPVLLGVAALVWWRSDPAPIAELGSGLGSVALLPLRVLLVPILLLAAVCVVGARLGSALVRRRHARLRAGKVVGLLARRRLQHTLLAAAVLSAVTALPIGLALFSSTVTGSVKATLAAESRVFTGADVVVTLSRPVAIPDSLRDKTTEVVRIEGPTFGGSLYTILLIDPESFSRVTPWDARINGENLAETVAAVGLRQGRQHVAVMGPATGTLEATILNRDVELDVAKRVRLLPAGTNYPVMLADRSVLGDDLPPALPRQWWISGSPDEVRRMLTEAAVPVRTIQVADDLYRGTYLEPITYTFDYLAALSMLAGVVSAVGFLLYLESRLPSLRRGYVVLRRMGLSKRRHVALLAVEFGLPLLLGLGIGIAGTAGVVALLARYFQINERAQPDTVLTVPYGLLAALAGAVLLTAVAATGFAEAHVRRAKGLEVLGESL